MKLEILSQSRSFALSSPLRQVSIQCKMLRARLFYAICWSLEKEIAKIRNQSYFFCLSSSWKEENHHF